MMVHSIQLASHLHSVVRPGPDELLLEGGVFFQF